MIARRTVVLGLLASTFTVSPGSAAPAPTAQEFVEKIYDAYKGSDAKGVSIATAAELRRYFAPPLVDIMIKDRAAADRRREVPTLDGDPFVNAQDFEIKNIEISVRDTARNKATATVTFINFDKANTVTLDLVRLPAGWRIADITWNGKDTLSGLYHKPTRGKRR